MYEYFRALHQRFFREPDHTELYEEIEENRKVLAENLGPEDRKHLLSASDSAFPQAALFEQMYLPQNDCYGDLKSCAILAARTEC